MIGDSDGSEFIDLSESATESEQEFGPDCFIKCMDIFWIKVIFTIFCFFLGLLGGLLPTWSESFRTSPSLFGITNSFAAGIFLAIALIHVLPEEIEAWADRHEPGEKVFPLPELLCFGGYTIIMILDKVLFNTHAFFDDDKSTSSSIAQPLPRNVRMTLERAQSLPDDACSVYVRETKCDLKMSIE